MSQVFVVQLPLLIDNPISDWIGIHPLKSTKWKYLEGSVYIVEVNNEQIDSFLKVLRYVRLFNIVNLFDDPLIFRFDSWDEAEALLSQLLS